MSYSVGQRIGRLTVTKTSRFGTAEQVRCDCGTEIAVHLEFDFLAPPDEIGEFHARDLLLAEAGLLRYDPVEYRIHGVSNNAADARWRGLLADAPDGPVLTDLGAHMLAHYKEKQPEEHAAAAEPPQAAAVPEPARGGAEAVQLDLGLLDDDHDTTPRHGAGHHHREGR